MISFKEHQFSRWSHPQISNNCQLTCTHLCKHQSWHKSPHCPNFVPHQAVHSENVLIIKAQRGKNVSTSVFLLLFKLCLTHVVIENHVEFRENIPQRRRSLQGKSSNWKKRVTVEVKLIVVFDIILSISTNLDVSNEPTLLTNYPTLACDLLVILVPNSQ